MTPLVVRRRSPARRCVACHDDLSGESFSCPGCGVTLHQACLPDLARCPTLGCRRPLRLAARTPADRRTREGSRALAAAVVLVPGALAALWPVLLWASALLAVRLSDALELSMRIALVPLAWLGALMAPVIVGLGALAPLARARDLPGRHERRVGLSALAGYVAGTLGLLPYIGYVFHV